MQLRKQCSCFYYITVLSEQFFSLVWRDNVLMDKTHTLLGVQAWNGFGSNIEQCDYLVWRVTL